LCHGGLTDAGPFRYVHDPAEFIKPSFEMAVEWLTSMPFRTDELTSEEREIYDDLHRLSVEDITWSDWGPNMPSTEPNMTRARDKDGNPTPLGLYFGSDALGRYLDILGAQVMIRGHQKWIPGADKLSNGVWCAGDSLLTINSSTPVSKFVKDKHGSFREVAVWAPNYLEIDLSAPVRSARDITVHMI
jgi:hypothetical protein